MSFSQVRTPYSGISSFLDLSPTYGATAAEAKALRAFSGGRLAANEEVSGVAIPFKSGGGGGGQNNHGGGRGGGGGHSQPPLITGSRAFVTGA